MDMRVKGLEIAARCRIAFKDGAWIVASQSGNGTYRVTLTPQGDFSPAKTSRLPAKFPASTSICALTGERDHGGKSPVIDMDVIPKRKTYAQDWPAHNLKAIH